MSNFLSGFQQLSKVSAYQLLTKVCKDEIVVQFKLPEEKKIFRSKLKRKDSLDSFYLLDDAIHLSEDTEITVKIQIEKKLFFLKTVVRNKGKYLHLDSFNNTYELIRRRSPRFYIPEHWPQEATLHAAAANSRMRSTATIIEMSQLGMKLAIEADIPRYETDQIIKLYFKMFRRAEVILKAKIIHLKKIEPQGSRLGIEFIDLDTLQQLKVKNYCDDLAFYHAALESLL